MGRAVAKLGGVRSKLDAEKKIEKPFFICRSLACRKNNYSTEKAFCGEVVKM